MVYTHSDGLDEADTRGRTRRREGGREGGAYLKTAGNTTALDQGSRRAWTRQCRTTSAHHSTWVGCLRRRTGRLGREGGKEGGREGGREGWEGVSFCFFPYVGRHGQGEAGTMVREGGREGGRARRTFHGPGDQDERNDQEGVNNGLGKTRARGLMRGEGVSL